MTISAEVLLLNKSWRPVTVSSIERAFGLLVTGSAKALDEEYRLLDYESWSSLSADLNKHETIRTPSKVLRIPRILVLQVYDKLPDRRIRFSRNNVYSRDNFVCQYCGEKFSRDKINLDHVIPRCSGGRTVWENVVCSCIRCNVKKGGRTPEEAGMGLLKKPRQPTWADLNTSLEGRVRYKEWLPFIDPAAAAYWNAELED